MARVTFWDLFQLNPDGSIQPKKKIKISGISIDAGVKLTRGVAFSGYDLFQYYGRDLEVEERPAENLTEITGIF